MNISEEDKWLLAVTFFEATNSVFNITDEKNSFSIRRPSYWSLRGRAETINKLQNLLELKSQNDFALHVEEIRKRGHEKNRRQRIWKIWHWYI